MEDFTPRYQARPQDWAVDLDLTGALRHLDRTPKEKRPRSWRCACSPCTG
ncbi:hypothetical protein ACFYOD_33395 [Streptomyces sp. NPDC006703]